jgi:electron transfer flavoprotein beta subunit
LILCGKKAIDSNGGQIGSFIAELLRVPQISGIVGLTLFAEEGNAVVKRYLGKGDKEEMECPLPALFTAEMGLNDPRYPTLSNRLAAEKAGIKVLNPAALEVSSDGEESRTEIMQFSQPRPKTRKVFTPDSSLSGADRLKQMMSGGSTEESTDILEGPADQLAGHIADFMIQEQILKDE